MYYNNDKALVRYNSSVLTKNFTTAASKVYTFLKILVMWESLI